MTLNTTTIIIKYCYAECCAYVVMLSVVKVSVIALFLYQNHCIRASSEQKTNSLLVSGKTVHSSLIFVCQEWSITLANFQRVVYRIYNLSSIQMSFMWNIESSCHDKKIEYLRDVIFRSCISILINMNCCQPQTSYLVKLPLYFLERPYWTLY
jgi:hypothetical protein